MVPVIPMIGLVITGVLLVGGVFLSRRLIHNVCFFFSVEESIALANLGSLLLRATRIFLMVQCLHIIFMLAGLGHTAPDLTGGVVVLCFYAWLGMFYAAIVLRQMKDPTLFRLITNFIVIILQAISWFLFTPWDFAPFG
jgi:hypothetical protein